MVEEQYIHTIINTTHQKVT